MILGGIPSKRLLFAGGVLGVAYAFIFVCVASSRIIPTAWFSFFLRAPLAHSLFFLSGLCLCIVAPLLLAGFERCILKMIKWYGESAPKRASMEFQQDRRAGIDTTNNITVRDDHTNEGVSILVRALGEDWDTFKQAIDRVIAYNNRHPYSPEKRNILYQAHRTLLFEVVDTLNERAATDETVLGSCLVGLASFFGLGLMLEKNGEGKDALTYTVHTLNCISENAQFIHLLCRLTFKAENEVALSSRSRTGPVIEDEVTHSTGVGVGP